jgi:hypothetical protein
VMTPVGALPNPFTISPTPGAAPTTPKP